MITYYQHEIFHEVEQYCHRRAGIGGTGIEGQAQGRSKKDITFRSRCHLDIVCHIDLVDHLDPHTGLVQYTGKVPVKKTSLKPGGIPPSLQMKDKL